MIKKTIKFEDFNGDEVSTDEYFHLSAGEIARMELSVKGGLKAELQRMVDAEDGKQIMETVDWILKSAYGKRSEDGKSFRKSDEIWNDFVASGAYDGLFFELITNADKASDFINGILPAGALAKAQENKTAESKALEGVIETAQKPAMTEAELRVALAKLEKLKEQQA